MRRFTAWLAILGLYLQLAAAAACGAGAASGVADVDPGLFPICHAQDDGAGRSDGRRAPVHRHDCPFCSIHCHLGLALPSRPVLAQPVRIAALAPPPAWADPAEARAFAGAQPRGPPVRG